MSEKHIFKEKLNAEVKAEGQRHLWWNEGDYSRSLGEEAEGERADVNRHTNYS